ncbi:MAG TPA: CopD family protein [Pseudonocardiaceae bacterium]|jgi:putative copper resistance protein D|nr:CopD family protein [Pseudonocardiaceae bacterium]
MTTTATTARRAHYPLLVVLACGAVFGVLVGIALTAAAVVPGIVAPSMAVVVGLPLSRALVDLAALTTVGVSLLPRLIGVDKARRPGAALALARRVAVPSAAVWLVAALTSLVVEVADFSPGQPVTIAAIERYVRQIPSGEGLLVVACCALLYLVIAVLALYRGESVPAELRITVAMFALLPLPVTGHAAMDTAGWRDVTTISLELHVISAVCWTGGLLAVLMLLAHNRDLLAEGLPRFSRLATVCVFTVAVTGAFNGWFELYDTPGVHWYVALFTTGYGWILIAKGLCVVGAGLLGGYTRFKLLPKIIERNRTAVLSWVTMEVAVLGIAFGLAAVLVRAPVVSG